MEGVTLAEGQLLLEGGDAGGRPAVFRRETGENWWKGLKEAELERWEKRSRRRRRDWC